MHCENCDHNLLVAQVLEVLETIYIDGDRDPYEMARATRDVSVIFSKIANDEMFSMEFGD